MSVQPAGLPSFVRIGDSNSDKYVNLSNVSFISVDQPSHTGWGDNPIEKAVSLLDSKGLPIGYIYSKKHPEEVLQELKDKKLIGGYLDFKA